MADFYQAIPITLANEGGYVNDPNDPGGETKYGISKRRYPNLDIKNLTVADATAIYLRDFWLFGGLVSQAVANKMFDMYVNMEHAVIKIAQSIINVPVDGVYGPHTETAINASDPVLFLPNLKAHLATHYRAIAMANPNEAKFLNDWLRRAAQ